VRYTDLILLPAGAAIGAAVSVGDLAALVCAVVAVVSSVVQTWAYWRDRRLWERRREERKRPAVHVPPDPALEEPHRA